MSIERWNGGWYIISVQTYWKGPYLTFKEAYDMFDLLKQQSN
jgi:hypothetical protein